MTTPTPSGPIITDAMRAAFEMYDEGDADVRSHEIRIVTSRKSFVCVNCQKTIEAGKRAYVESAFVNSRPCKSRTCLPCVDVAMIEAGEVEDLARNTPAPPERVLCAAIWVDTGKAEPPRRSYSYPATGLLFCGWRHGDCFTTLNAWAERLTPEERAEIGEEQIRGRHQGFLTSTGRFVDREEAMTIARVAGQTTSEKSGLFSEDLY